MDFKFKPSCEKPSSLEGHGTSQRITENIGVPRIHDNQQLREADAKLKEFVDRQSCAQSFDWLTDILIFMALASTGLFLGGVVLAATFSVVMLGLLVYKHFAIRSYTRRISVSGLSAGVLYKIILGPEELGKIYSYVPIPWRWLFLMLRPKKVADWVFLVAQNLDWYQQEPRFYLPTRWIIQTVLFVIAACFYENAVFGNFANFNGKEYAYYFMAFFPLMILVGLGNKMKLAGAIELRAELKTVLPARKRTPLKAEDI